jgi:predicted Zn-dependent protease
MLGEMKLVERKLDKAYFYLDHCLKFDYRNPIIWSLLGEIYSLKGHSQHYGNSEESDFNMEKATFCYLKSAKYA